MKTLYPPETYRRAMELRLRGNDGQPMSVSEVANALGIPDTIVYQWTRHLRPIIDPTHALRNVLESKNRMRNVKDFLGKTSENPMPQLVVGVVEDLLDALSAMVESNQRTFDSPSVYVHTKEASDKLQKVMKNAVMLDPEHVKRQRETRDSLLRLARKHLASGDKVTARQFVKQAGHAWLLGNDQKKEFKELLEG